MLGNPHAMFIHKPTIINVKHYKKITVAESVTIRPHKATTLINL